MTDGSEAPTPPDGEDTPDYKAMYEAANAEKEKLSGQYKSIQKKHNASAKVSKDEYSKFETDFAEMKVKMEAMEAETITTKRNTLLSQLKPETAEKYKDADVATLSMAIEIAGPVSGFPQHGAQKGAISKPKAKNAGYKKLGSKEWTQ